MKILFDKDALLISLNTASEVLRCKLQFAYLHEKITLQLLLTFYLILFFCQFNTKRALPRALNGLLWILVLNFFFLQPILVHKIFKLDTFARLFLDLLLHDRYLLLILFYYLILQLCSRFLRNVLVNLLFFW